MLAGSPPLDLTVIERKRAFEQRARDRKTGTIPLVSRVNRRTRKLKDRTIREWAARIPKDERARGNRMVNAILPILKRWMNRAYGSLTYRTTQLLTGHGCFGYSTSTGSVENPRPADTTAAGLDRAHGRKVRGLERREVSTGEGAGT